MLHLRRLIFEPEHDMSRGRASCFAAADVAPHTLRQCEQGIVDGDACRRYSAAGLLCLWADPAHFGARVRNRRHDQIVIDRKYSAARSSQGIGRSFVRRVRTTNAKGRFTSFPDIGGPTGVFGDERWATRR